MLMRRPVGGHRFSAGTAALALGLGAVLALAAGCGRNGSPFPKDTSGEPPSANAASAAVQPASDTAPGEAPASAVPAGAWSAKDVVLRVGPSRYTAADFQASLRALGGGEALALEPEALSRLFDDFVREKLLLAAAKSAGVAVTDEETRRAMSGLAPGDTEAAARPEGSAASAEFVEHLIIEKYARGILKDAAAVDEAAVRAEYEAGKKDFLLPERVRVSQILLRTEQDAVNLLRRLRGADEAAFRAAAREASQGPEAPRGGVLGVFKAGDLPADVEKVVFALDEGTVSNVFESSYGFHIFRLDKRFPPELVPFAQAAPQIRSRLQERRLQEGLDAHVAKLRETLDWAPSPENLPFPYTRTAS